MIQSVFHLPVPALEKILRAALVYVFLVIALRLAGKRELAQLSTPDFVVLLAVANAVQNGIIGNDNSVTGGALSATTFFVLNAAVAFVVYRSARARFLVMGGTELIVVDGQPCYDALRREGITMEELLVALQREGADDLSEVQAAVLEPGGSILITKRANSDERRAIEALSHKIDALIARLDADGRR